MTVALVDYPGIKSWYEFVQADHSMTCSAEIFVISTCKLLEARPSDAAEEWANLFVEYLLVSSEPSQAFIEIQNLFNENQTDFLSFIGDMGEQTIASPSAAGFQKAMEESADATNLACLRFMSAWVCINEGEMQKCVDQCELIDEIYAPILTIKGQAQISLGHIEEAILTLVDACKHSPQEILAWFQLAKAYHITNRPEASWNALLKCENLAPQSAEVSLFMGIVALEMEQSDKVLHAYECLSSHQSYLIKNASLNLTLIKLSLKIGDPAQIKEIIAIPDWDAIVDQPEFFREIPGILRDLEELDQMNIARDLLIIPHTFANSRPLIQSA